MIFGHTGHPYHREESASHPLPLLEGVPQVHEKMMFIKSCKKHPNIYINIPVYILNIPDIILGALPLGEGGGAKHSPPGGMGEYCDQKS